MTKTTVFMRKQSTPRSETSSLSHVSSPDSDFHQSLSSDDPDLLAFQSKVKGSEYENVINPWANYTYHESWLDKIGNFFNVPTFADKLAIENAARSREWMSQILKEISDNAYNSPEESAERMRAAGLNPDLQGIGDANQASSVDQPAQGVTYDPQSDTRALGETIGLAFKAAMSMVNAGISINSALINLKGADISRVKDLSSMASRAVQSLDPQTLDHILSTDYGVDDMMSDFGDLYQWRSKKNKLSFLSALKSEARFTRNRAEAFKNKSALGESMKDLSDMENSSWFDWSFKTMGVIRQPLVKMMDELTSINYKYEIDKTYTADLESLNRSAYLEKAAELGLPQNAAQADYESALASQHTAKYNQTYFKYRNDVLRKLHQDAKTNPFSNFLEFCWVTGYAPNVTTAAALGLNLVGDSGLLTKTANEITGTVKYHRQERKDRRLDKEARKKWTHGRPHRGRRAALQYKYYKKKK